MWNLTFVFFFFYDFVDEEDSDNETDFSYNVVKENQE